MKSVALPFPVPTNVMESLKDRIAPEQFPPRQPFLMLLLVMSRLVGARRLST